MEMVVGKQKPYMSHLRWTTTTQLSLSATTRKHRLGVDNSFNLRSRKYGFLSEISLFFNATN
jgi:hypothetical protein